MRAIPGRGRDHEARVQVGVVQSRKAEGPRCNSLYTTAVHLQLQVYFNSRAGAVCVHYSPTALQYEVYSTATQVEFVLVTTAIQVYTTAVQFEVFTTAVQVQF